MLTTYSIIVTDNGPGIPAEFLERIWEPFFTTKSPSKGTGLGLSVSQNIVTAHDGRISAENDPDGGARFTIALPASRDAHEGATR